MPARLHRDRPRARDPAARRGRGIIFDGETMNPRVPQVRQAKAEVLGPMDRDLVRRIVRAHIHAGRDGYEQALNEFN